MGGEAGPWQTTRDGKTNNEGDHKLSHTQCPEVFCPHFHEKQRVKIFHWAYWTEKQVTVFKSVLHLSLKEQLSCSQREIRKQRPKINQPNAPQKHHDVLIAFLKHPKDVP